MKLAGPHPDELRRLQSLRASGLLNSGKEERFDRLTRLARTLYDLPVASISLVGENTLHVKSCAGLDVDTLPRDITFCAHTILQTDPLIVNDLQQDMRFHDSPLVTEAPFIRFYAGYPVQLPDGATVGSFCLMDHKPRAFSGHEIQILSDLAAIVEDEFKVLDAATADELTGLFNRRGFLSLAEYALLTARRRSEPASLVFIDLDRFKLINDTWGHEQGDKALTAIADVMKSTFRESDLIARQGGDEFIILLANTAQQAANKAMEQLSQNVAEYNQQAGNPWQLAFSWGCVEYDPHEHHSLNDIVAVADRRMYQAKTSHGAERR